MNEKKKIVKVKYESTGAVLTLSSRLHWWHFTCGLRCWRETLSYWREKRSLGEELCGKAGVVAPVLFALAQEAPAAHLWPVIVGAPLLDVSQAVDFETWPHFTPDAGPNKSRLIKTFLFLSTWTFFFKCVGWIRNKSSYIYKLLLNRHY